jgi:23S rRNA (guanosine2251-2'-O)-methyltransferase
VYVVGSETEGISREIDALIDERLSIPMEGGVDSLNVAVAASLVCYQARAAAAQAQHDQPRRR